MRHWTARRGEPGSWAGSWRTRWRTLTWMRTSRTSTSSSTRREPPQGVRRATAPGFAWDGPFDRPPARQYPQLLHRGAHRPREEHAGRPPARDHPYAHAPTDARASARRHGPRAGEGDHDQVARDRHGVRGAR